MNFPSPDCQLGDFLPLLTPIPSSPEHISRSRISKPRSPSKKPPPPKIFACSSPNCGKRFSKKWNLQAHERLHTGSTPFVCRLGCGEAYMWMSSRKGHELNRCKYSLKKKTARASARNTSGQAEANSGTKTGTISGLTGTSDSYETPAFSVDLRPTSKSSKEADSSDSLVVLEEISDCLSNVTEDVLDREEVDKGESTMLMDADLVLADISLPDTDIFTDDFLEWLLTRCGPTETQYS